MLFFCEEFHRIVQYEKGVRVPKKDLVDKMAQALDINPYTLYDTAGRDASEMMELLFWLDEFNPYALHLFLPRKFPGEKCNEVADTSVYYHDKLDNQKEVEKLLEQYILRFERNPKEEPELSRFHLFDAKGNVKGVRDMEIVDYLVENVQFFVVGITPYYYEHGVFLEDHDGVRMKYRIQKLIYRDQVQSGVIKRIYNLLIAQPKVHREAYELNKQPVRWINFKNGYYDPVTGEMLEHNLDYLTINQIPFPYYPEDREQMLQGGENIKKYLASSLPNKEEQQTFWEYFGYCMTQDTQFQKFLTLKGNGGTGKSVAVSLIQYVVGITNMSSISLQDLNKRFYATGMYGKLLNACADIPCKAMENTDVLKKAVGEDTLIYEKKGQDAIHFHSYAKLLFSTNEMPKNLENKSDAFYRRLLILDMNRVVKVLKKICT